MRRLLDDYYVDLAVHPDQSGLSILRFHGFEDVTFAMKRPVDNLGTEEKPVTHTFMCSRVSREMTGGGVPASKISQLRNTFVRLNCRGQDGGFQPVALKIPAMGGPLQWPPEGPRTIPCSSGIFRYHGYHGHIRLVGSVVTCHRRSGSGGICYTFDEWCDIVILLVV